VNEGTKCIIPERIMSIESESNQFSDLFDAITLKQYNDREVKVFIKREKSEDMPDSIQNELSVETDAFNILMRNSREPLLPQRCTEHNNHDRLHNEIIELFQAQEVGWTNGLHETIGKTFINRLTTHPSNSLKIFISQPWASSNSWSKVMPAIFSLIKILKKYSDYLIATTTSMNELHYSNESARSPENNSTMYQVSACEPYQLKDEYTQLDDLLFEKTFYEHVDV
ncbi:24713_t:CDS:2, partial [Gigaspora margarita]